MPLGRRSLRWAVSQLQEGFLAEDDFGAQDDYQRELDEEAEFEQQRLDAERRNAAENVAGITLLQEGTNKSFLSSLGFRSVMHCLLYGGVRVRQSCVSLRQGRC